MKRRIAAADGRNRVPQRRDLASGDGKELLVVALTA